MKLPQNPRAVVTGGAGGLGRAFCLQLAKRGGRIVVADIDLAGADECAKLVEDAGGQAHIIRCDVSELAQVEGLLSFALERLGGVDIIVNNAGVAVAGPVGEIPIADWQWILGINLWGVIYGCHVFVPHFKRQGHGRVINVASAAGLVSSSEMAPYNVTKAAVVALSETLAGELAGTDVGVTVLCPTFFQTNIVKSGRTRSSAETEAIATTMMVRSKIQADEVARLAIAGADTNKLYVVPMADGRWMWRVKRLTPESFYQTIVPFVVKKLRGRFAKSQSR